MINSTSTVADLRRLVRDNEAAIKSEAKATYAGAIRGKAHAGGARLNPA